MTKKDYPTLVAAIAEEVVQVMRERMGRQGDYRSLFVYVSYVDGGWCVGHGGQHAGMWRSAAPVATSGTAYNRVGHNVWEACRSAPLYATPDMGLTG
jgi:hypothetical protein